MATKGGWERGHLGEKWFPSGSCKLSCPWIVSDFFLGEQASQNEWLCRGCQVPASMVAIPALQRMSSAPAPSSIRGPNRPPRIFALRKIYLFIYNIYICVCLITTHPHAYTYFYLHSLTRAPTMASYVFTFHPTEHYPCKGKDGRDTPFPWGFCLFPPKMSSSTPYGERQLEDGSSQPATMPTCAKHS